MPVPSDPRGRELYLMVSRDAYERWLARETESLLRNGFNDVVTTLVTRYNDLSIAQRTRQLQLFGQIEHQLSDAYGQADKFAAKQFDAYAGVESAVTRAHLQALVARGDVNLTFDALSKAEIRNIAALPIAGLNLGDWFEKQAQDMSVETRRQIQMGLLQGETPQQIVRRIMPADVSSPAVLRTARRNASTLVRTSVTTVHNNAALETMVGAGPKVTDSYRYIAVRDARTSAICQALSNKVFAFKDPKKKMPPQHPNCRSTIVAEINYEKLGLPRPPEKSPLSFQSYDSWLKEQSPEMQSVILGPSRQALYASGRVPLADMVATDNRTLTLEQLRHRFSNVEPVPIVVQTAEQRYQNVLRNFNQPPYNVEGIDTLSQYTMDSGKLTPQRQELNDAIVNKILAGHSAQESPIVQITGGGPASGKSVMTSKMEKLRDAVHVDVDQIRELLPEWKNSGIAEIGTFTHEESSAIAKRIVKEAVKSKYNIVTDGAYDGGYDWLEEKITGYKVNGHRVVANYVTVDTDTAFERSIARGDAMAAAGQTPRYVPEDYLRRMHAGVSEAFPVAVERGIFDEFVLWDTNQQPAIKVVSGRGSSITIYHRDAWERFLAKALAVAPGY